MREGNGTAFVVLRVKPNDPPAFKRNMDAPTCRDRFRAALLDGTRTIVGGRAGGPPWPDIARANYRNTTKIAFSPQKSPDDRKNRMLFQWLRS